MLKELRFSDSIPVGSVLSFYDGDSIGIIIDIREKKFFEGKMKVFSISWNKVGKSIDKLLEFQKNDYITEDILQEYYEQNKVKIL